MKMPTPDCPACRVPMQEGFVPDVAHNGRNLVTRWTEGPAKKSLLRGVDVRAARQLETVTFRCPKCGWLIWFAPDAAEAP